MKKIIIIISTNLLIVVFNLYSQNLSPEVKALLDQLPPNQRELALQEAKKLQGQNLNSNNSQEKSEKDKNAILMIRLSKKIMKIRRIN